MKLMIESTEAVTSMDGVLVRLWKGTTEAGVKCHVFVHRLAVANADDQSQFEAELIEQLPPGQAIPLSAIL